MSKLWSYGTRSHPGRLFQHGQVPQCISISPLSSPSPYLSSIRTLWTPHCLLGDSYSQKSLHVQPYSTQSRGGRGVRESGTRGRGRGRGDNRASGRTQWGGRDSRATGERRGRGVERRGGGRDGGRGGRGTGGGYQDRNLGRGQGHGNSHGRRESRGADGHGNRQDRAGERSNRGRGGRERLSTSTFEEKREDEWNERGARRSRGGGVESDYDEGVPLMQRGSLKGGQNGGRREGVVRGQDGQRVTKSAPISRYELAAMKLSMRRQERKKEEENENEDGSYYDGDNGEDGEGRKGRERGGWGGEKKEKVSRVGPRGNGRRRFNPEGESALSVLSPKSKCI